MKSWSRIPIYDQPFFFSFSAVRECVYYDARHSAVARSGQTIHERFQAGRPFTEDWSSR